MSNKVLFKTDASTGMKEGIDIGTNAVCVTLGYGGRTVFISKKGMATEATKDGVKVINSIRLKDPIQDAGLKLIQDISSNTAKVVGDGTTTVCVLMREMITQGLMLKQSGLNVIELKKGMELASSSILQTLDKIKKTVGDDKKILKQIATVSANNDSDVGNIIGSMFETIGKYGTIHIEDGNQAETTIELVKGFEFQSGFFSPYFINTKKNTCEIMNPYILIVEGKVDKTAQILPILEKVVTEGRGVVIMAEDFDHLVMADVLTNINKGKLNASLIKYTVSGDFKEELLLDLCALTGATLITNKTGEKIENIKLSYLGQCEKVVSTKTDTTVFNGTSNKEKVDLRIDDATQKIKSAKNPFMIEKYEYRLAKLLGNVAICYVGGITDVETKEKKDRIDDAVRATKAAIEEGVVPGGGTALLRCIDALSRLSTSNDSQKAGINLVKKSIEKPFWQICANAGHPADLLLEKVKARKGNFGFNAKTGKIEDLFLSGIIDPAKVVRVEIENSVSGAIQFLISDCAIIDED